VRNKEGKNDRFQIPVRVLHIVAWRRPKSTDATRADFGHPLGGRYQLWPLRHHLEIQAARILAKHLYGNLTLGIRQLVVVAEITRRYFVPEPEKRRIAAVAIARPGRCERAMLKERQGGVSRSVNLPSDAGFCEYGLPTASQCRKDGVAGQVEIFMNQLVGLGPIVSEQEVGRGTLGGTGDTEIELAGSLPMVQLYRERPFTSGLGFNALISKDDVVHSESVADARVDSRPVLAGKVPGRSDQEGENGSPGPVGFGQHRVFQKTG